MKGGAPDVAAHEVCHENGGRRTVIFMKRAAPRAHEVCFGNTLTHRSAEAPGLQGTTRENIENI